MRRVVYWLSILLAMCSCASRDFQLVAKVTAAATYEQNAYVWKCVDQAGPTTCRPCQTAINDAAKQVPVANAVQKIGPMPSKERAELEDLLVRLEACP